MADNIWESGSVKIAQIDTCTPANVGVGDIFTVQIEDYLGITDKLTYTALNATVKDVVDALGLLIVNATTEGNAPWDKITAIEDDALITLTGTAGYPFTTTLTATDGDAADTQTFTQATSTACSGPNLYNDSGNWSLQAVPVNDDDVIIPYSASSDIYGYDASGVDLTSFTIEEGCPINIGSPLKYLDVEVKTAGVFTLGGLGLIYLNSTCSTNDGTMVINDAGTGGGDYGFSLNLKGNSITTLSIDASGSSRIGLGTHKSSTMAILTSITVKNGIVEIGTVTGTPDLTVYGGSVNVKSALGDVIVHDGVVYDYAGNKVLVDIRGNGTVDCSKSNTAKTYTDTHVFSGAVLNDPLGTLTLTNGIDYMYCDLDQVTIKHGPHRTWSPSVIGA